MSDLSRDYFFFIKEKGSYKIHQPKNIQEYIQFESKTEVGTVCINLWFNPNNGFLRIKSDDLYWRSTSKVELPIEIQAWLVATGTKIL